LHKLTVLDGQAPEIVFEATGVYSKGLEKFLCDNGYRYSRMNPLEANLQMAYMRRHKTDKSDAHELAKTHFKMESDYTYQQDDYYEQQLITPRSALFLNIVQLYSHPAMLVAHSKTVIRSRLKNNTQKNLSAKRSEEKAIVLLEAAQESYPTIFSTDIRCEHVNDYAKRIADLKEKKEQLVKQMIELSEERSEYQVLMPFPGIGEIFCLGRVTPSQTKKYPFKQKNKKLLDWR